MFTEIVRLGAFFNTQGWFDPANFLYVYVYCLNSDPQLNLMFQLQHQLTQTTKQLSAPISSLAECALMVMNASMPMVGMSSEKKSLFLCQMKTSRRKSLKRSQKCQVSSLNYPVGWELHWAFDDNLYATNL